jgi:hypothetical protein
MFSILVNLRSLILVRHGETKSLDWYYENVKNNVGMVNKIYHYSNPKQFLKICYNVNNY